LSLNGLRSDFKRRVCKLEFRNLKSRPFQR
jgi:hypothetical protein